MSMRRTPLFSIPPGVPFLATLVDALMNGTLVPAISSTSDPLLLASATIYVPSRRSARVLEEVLANRMSGMAMLMPRILPLGDPAEIEDRIVPIDLADAALALPEAIDDLSRRLVLMQWIDRWRAAIDSLLRRNQTAQGDRPARDALLDVHELFQVAATRRDAFALAGDLAVLIDEMTIEGANWRKIATLAPAEHDHYWALTRKFLDIAGEQWPGVLAERDLIDHADRRQRLLAAETERLTRDRPQDVVIIAGSTGSQPASARLMKAVLGLQNGAVVLPGLDRDHLDEAGWNAIALDGSNQARALTHPQAGLKRLLARLNQARETVIALGDEDDRASARHHMLEEAMRPAETSDLWNQVASRLDLPLALDGIRIVEALDEREEALAIAIAAREYLQQPDGVVVIVTPDRALAMYVVAELKRWGIEAQDSAGMPLQAAPAGRFARLALDAVIENFSSTALLAVLRDPALRLGLALPVLAAAVDALEITVLRGKRRHVGLAGLSRSDAAGNTSHPTRPERRLQGPAKALLPSFISSLTIAFDGLTDTSKGTLAALAACHRAIVLAASTDDTGGSILFEGPDGAGLAAVFDALVASQSNEEFDLVGYRDLFDALLASETVMPTLSNSNSSLHSRIKILGPLEARLMPADLMILGGLNEGVWPPQTRADAFLTRSMRAELGLSPPERRIGQSAHDLMMFAGTQHLLLTRAARVAGTPGLSSRFLRRLEAVVGKTAWQELKAKGQPLLDMARQIDVPEPESPQQRPAPKPPVSRRPTRLSITEIGTLIRDPYVIYARHILKLDPLPDLDLAADAALRGTIAHEAFEYAIRTYPVDWPPDIASILATRMKHALARETDDPLVTAFWTPKFESMANWFAPCLKSQL